MSERAYSGFMSQVAAGERIRRADTTVYDEHDPVYQFVGLFLDTPELFGREYDLGIVQLNWTCGVEHVALDLKNMDAKQQKEARQMLWSMKDAPTIEVYTAAFPAHMLFIEKNWLADVYDRGLRQFGSPWKWQESPMQVMAMFREKIDNG